MTDPDVEYLLVAQYFKPDTASTGQLMTDLAVGLADRGLDMTVYTTQPNYHSGDFQKQPYSEQYEGVHVERIRAPQLKQTNLLRRAFNWVVYSLWMALALSIDRPDKQREILFVSNPPFFGLFMWPVCQLRGWEYTYIVHDLWPEKGTVFGFYATDGIVDRVWSAAHTVVLRDARSIVTLGPKMKDGIVSYDAGADLEEKVRVIDNWADADFIEPMDKSENPFSHEHDLVDTFTLLYSGNIGLFHDLETLVRGAAQFDPDELNVLIIGEGDNKQSIVELAEALGVVGETVDFLPYQPRDRIPESLTCADASVVTVREGFEGTCVSSKLYTALATGQPVLVIAQPDSDEARIVRTHDAGETVPQGDIPALVEVIERWKADPDVVRKQGKNARRAFEEQFDKEIAIDQYYEMLTETQ